MEFLSSFFLCCVSPSLPKAMPRGLKEMLGILNYLRLCWISFGISACYLEQNFYQIPIFDRYKLPKIQWNQKPLNRGWVWLSESDFWLFSCFSNVCMVTIQASPEDASSEQKRNFQTRVLLSAMDVFHVISQSEGKTRPRGEWRDSDH